MGARTSPSARRRNACGFLPVHRLALRVRRCAHPRQPSTDAAHCAASAIRLQRRLMQRSCEPGSFLVAAGATFGGEEFAVMHFEGLVLHGLPFVKAGLAQGDAAGFCLAADAAGGLEVDDVGHLRNLFRA